MSTAVTVPVAQAMTMDADRAVGGRPLDPRTYLVGFVSAAAWISTLSDLLPAILWSVALLTIVVVRRKRNRIQIVEVRRLLLWLGVAAIATFMLYLLFVPVSNGAGDQLFGFSLEHETVRFGCVMALRLVALVLLSLTFFSFVSALDLAAGTTRLLLPLRRFGVPVMSFYYLAFFLARMIPGLIGESRLIGMAQRSRGIGTPGSRLRALRAYPALVIPVFASALRRSEQMALAFASRGFDEDHVPIEVTRLRMRVHDLFAVGVLIAGWLAWIYTRPS